MLTALSLQKLFLIKCWSMTSSSHSLNLMTLIKRTKGNGLHSAIICEIPKELKEKIISIQRLWFGYFTAYIKNFVKTKQCYNCAEFGHFKNKCSNNPACILCSGPHSLFECPSKDSKMF